MKVKLVVLALAFMFVPAVYAQQKPASFSIQAYAVALPGPKEAVPASDVGATLALTPKLSIRSDNILAPAANLQAYLGGLEYVLPFDRLLRKTKMPADQFEIYASGSLGIARVTSSKASDQQHIAALLGGGLNYHPKGNGAFSINLFEARWAKFPGFANSTVLVSTGVKLSF